MSLESAKKFLEKIQHDDAFEKSFFALTAPEERKVFIKDNGFEFTKEEIDEARAGFDVSGGKCCGYTCESEPCTNDCDLPP